MDAVRGSISGRSRKENQRPSCVSEIQVRPRRPRPAVCCNAAKTPISLSPLAPASRARRFVDAVVSITLTSKIRSSCSFTNSSLTCISSSRSCAAILYPRFVTASIGCPSDRRTEIFFHSAARENPNFSASSSPLTYSSPLFSNAESSSSRQGFITVYSFFFR